MRYVIFLHISSDIYYEKGSSISNKNIFKTICVLQCVLMTIGMRCEEWIYYYFKISKRYVRIYTEQFKSAAHIMLIYVIGVEGMVAQSSSIVGSIGR